MHPRDYISNANDAPALIIAATGEMVGFSELGKRTNQIAHFFRNQGIETGDCVAVWMQNESAFLDVCWAAHNAGLLYVPVSTRLKVDEVAYIIRDSGASVVIVSDTLDHKGLAASLGEDFSIVVTGKGGNFEAQVRAMPSAPLTNETRGAPMMYSSGTTGRPKGIAPDLEAAPIDEASAVTEALIRLYGFDQNTIYLSTAPMYHAAPLKFAMAVQQAGGTVVMMEKFDARQSLHLIEKFGVTHSQWVPTMFIRLLRLDEEDRRRDFSTHQYAIHGAAPCPVEIKERMMNWWGPIIHEYYGGSESVGMCAISPFEWLRKKGSVGRASRGIIHILDEDGRELGSNKTGLIYFEGGSKFSYLNDPDKTERSFNSDGWGTFGDIGHVDDDGYLFLTDRRDYVINVAGVNIYPQEVENLLSTHPKVADAAVFGVPNQEYGEEVKAVIEPRFPNEVGPEFANELIVFCRERLAHNKCPRSIDFESDMPREPTGKLLKRVLKARYWPSEHTELQRARVV